MVQQEQPIPPSTPPAQPVQTPPVQPTQAQPTTPAQAKPITPAAVPATTQPKVTPPVKKKSKWKKWLIIGLIAMVIIGAALFIFIL